MKKFINKLALLLKNLRPRQKTILNQDTKIKTYFQKYCEENPEALECRIYEV